MASKWRLLIPFLCFTVLGFLCFFILGTQPVYAAASGSYGWTRTSGGTGEDWGGQDIATDSNGNVFATGGFEDTVDFDATSGTDSHTANGSYADIFITKYASDGSYGWTKTFGGTAEDYGQGIATDTDGNVFVTGYFQGTVDFDASTGVDSHSATWGTDIFITKYNSDGSYGWTRTMGATGDQLGYAATTDSSGNVIVIGLFSGTVNFDATGGVDNHVSSSGNIFITKYGSDGSYIWTKTFGNSSQDTYYDVATDADGYIYATGFFTGTADFDGSGGVDNYTSNGDDDIFVTRLSSDGTYKWTVTIGGTGSDRGSGVKTDTNGNVFVTGYFSNTVNFDTTGGTDNHTASGGKDIFILKLKENSKSVWAKSIGGSTIYDWANGVTTDTSGNIFITGTYGDTVNFDANGGTDNHTSGPGGDFFITKYNADGTYGWTRSSTGTAVDDCAEALAVVIYDTNAYLTGYYIGTINFNGAGGTENHTSSPGTFDFFMTKYTDDVPSVSQVSASPTGDSAGIAWTTNPASSSQVEYGLTEYFGTTTAETDTSTRVTTHTKAVSSLEACSRYYYRVLSTDTSGNKGISEKGSFNTSGCLVSSVTGGTESYTEVTGGTLELTNDLSTATIAAPDGYYSEGTTIQINILDSNSVPAAPSGTSLVRDNFYNLFALSDSNTEVTTFDEPVTFTVNYGSGIESVYQEATFDVYKYNGSSWDKQGCTLDTINNTLTCTLTGFSVYGVFGQEQSVTTRSASAPVCQDAKPVSIPNLFQINVEATKATLYFTPVTPDRRYFISFSTKPIAEQHGADVYLGNTGVQNFTVNYLSPNTTYYFKVRGQNGCMPGEWSNVLAAKTSAATSLVAEKSNKLTIKKDEVLMPTPKPTPSPTPTVSVPTVDEIQPVPKPEPFYLRIFKWILSLFSKIAR